MASSCVILPWLLRLAIFWRAALGVVQSSIMQTRAEDAARLQPSEIVFRYPRHSIFEFDSSVPVFILDCFLKVFCDCDGLEE